jgi:hypothetical protein
MITFDSVEIFKGAQIIEHNYIENNLVMSYFKNDINN